MRTDVELRADVLSELQSDTSIRNEDIAVAVQDGVITLAGTVDSYAQRYAAGRAVESVKGARGIVNDLVVKIPGALSRSDSDIAHSAVNALRWHIEVPEDRVRVKVSNGWLTLEGEVERYYEKESAERAVQYLIGLRGVTNLITLHGPVTPRDVKRRIRIGLERQATLDADQITVETIGSRVTLRGVVRSMAERGDAERAAWNAPGVTGVDNEIGVSPPIVTAF